MELPLSEIRAQFPILRERIDGHPLVYLDSAATSQKPQVVIDALQTFYATENANVKRGMHPIAERATEAYEAARERVRRFVNARKMTEIVFTKNCTEAINLVARSWGEANLRKGDIVLLSLLEHHSNIVPWLQLKEKIGIEVAWIGIEREGTLKVDDLKRKLKAGSVRLVSITCVSNVLGVVTPYREIVRLAHAHGALCLLDAAQLAPHAPMDVQEIDADFLAFSGHKVYGPTGIGVLYGKEKLLAAMPPFLGGGSMIQEVMTDRFTPTHLPEKFEAGTPPIAEAVALHAALDWLTALGWERMQEHERDILAYAIEKLAAFPFVEVLGPKDPTQIASCISFVVVNPRLHTTRPNGQQAGRANYKLQTQALHPHDLTEYIGRKGVCLRAGHHCTQPLHDFLGHPATSRLSVAIYTMREDIDRMCAMIEEAERFFTGI